MPFPMPTLQRLVRSIHTKSVSPGYVALVWLLATVGLFAQAPGTDPSATKPIFEEWVVVVLDGKTCGFGSTVTTKIDTASGPNYLTAHQEEFVVKRLGTNLKIVETSKVTEDAEGGVLSYDDISDAGSIVESKGVREGDDMVVSSRGQTQRFHLPRLSALGPEAVRRQTLAVPSRQGSRSRSIPSAPIIRRRSSWKAATWSARKPAMFAAPHAPCGR